MATRDAYASWAPSYDESSNQMIEIEQPLVWEILDRLPAGVALDAACGTGRHAARLVELGHSVIGVDGSPAMLDRARAKLPGVELHLGDCTIFPSRTIASTWSSAGSPSCTSPGSSRLSPNRSGAAPAAASSFPTGLRSCAARPPLVRERSDGGFGYVPTWRRDAAVYLAAALPLGLQVRACAEPLRPSPLVERGASIGDAAPPEPSATGRIDLGVVSWPLRSANDAYRGAPIALVLHFQLPETQAFSAPGIRVPARACKSSECAHADSLAERGETCPNRAGILREWHPSRGKSQSWTLLRHGRAPPWAESSYTS